MIKRFFGDTTVLLGRSLRRSLFTEQPIDSDLLVALAWSGGLLVVAYALAMTVYRRKISLRGMRWGRLGPC